MSRTSKRPTAYGRISPRFGGYDGLHLVYEALKKTGGDAGGDRLIAAMKGMAWESPRGPISIDPDTRDIVSNIISARSRRSTASSWQHEFATFPNVKDPIRGMKKA